MVEPLVIWDMEDDPDGNVAHIAEHGLTQNDVEEVVQSRRKSTIPHPRFPDRFLSFGWTESGLHIVVVWEHIDDDPETIKPITAYETPPPKPPTRKKR